jgi:hypothetical protein
MTTSYTLAPGDRVHRIEARAVIGATVIQIIDDAIEIAYDEGGAGWWPPECLSLIQPVE